MEKDNTLQFGGLTYSSPEIGDALSAIKELTDNIGEGDTYYNELLYKFGRSLRDAGKCNFIDLAESIRDTGSMTNVIYKNITDGGHFPIFKLRQLFKVEDLIDRAIAVETKQCGCSFRTDV